MPDQAALEALRGLIWGLYLLAMTAGAISVAITRRRCLARAVAALLLASLAQSAIEAWQAEPLDWWQHIAIDVPVLVAITMPPRNYWQSTLGALVCAQIVLHACWAMAPDLARWHWLGCVLLGLVKCLVILGWSGGKRVEDWLGRAARLPADLVLVVRAAKLDRW